jgi:hypothetical protein
LIQNRNKGKMIGLSTKISMRVTTILSWEPWRLNYGKLTPSGLKLRIIII